MANINVYDLHRRHLAGESLSAIARAVGVKKCDTVKNWFVKLGLATRGSDDLSGKLDVYSKKIITMFNDGNSVKKIAEEFMVARNVIVRVLKKNNIAPRNRSESMFLRMAQASPEERKEFARKANAAAKGRKCSIEERCKRAKTREDIKYAYRGEILAAEMFNKAGIDTVLQKACGPYNIDIFITKYSIAVEIFGGRWHCSGRHAERFRKRFDYIINSKIIPVVVWVVKDFPFDQSAVEKIIAIGEESRHNESVWRAEHVLRGDGQACTIGKGQLDYLPGVV